MRTDSALRRGEKPPAKDGVGASVVALPAGAWATVLDFLVEHFAHIPKIEWLARMERGEVLDDCFAPLACDASYIAGKNVFYYRNIADEPRIPFEETVIFRDDHLVIADKPHFLPVIPTGCYLRETLLVRLRHKLGIDTLTPIHRIDRDTAGIVVFAVRAVDRARYFELFRRRAVRKIYEAIAPWRAELQLPLCIRNRLQPSAQFMQMQAVDGPVNAETTIELCERRGERARYRLTPLTGKRHQLRAHMAELELPIENDRIYPRLLPQANDAASREREYREPLQLLAQSISFVDPITGVARDFESQRSLRWKL